MIANISFEIAQESDIEGVLDLQELYLVSNLTNEEKQNGFVTTPFTVAQLEFVIGNQGLFVAKDKSKIIAYIFAESWDFFKQYPIFEYMISLLPTFKFKGNTFTTKNSFQYGPICIHQEFRGKGLIVPFFEFMRQNVARKYPLSLTFINKINIPSYKAHTQKLKWNVIAEFEFNNNYYFVLAYEMKIVIL